MSRQRHKNVPASYLVLIKNNKILLLRRYNTGYQDGKYSFIAGHAERNETFTNTVIREAKEEAGIKVDSKNLEVAHIMHRKCPEDPQGENERIDTFFIAKKWQGKIRNCEPQKCDRLNWFNLDNLPPNIIPYIKQAIDCIKNRIFYSEHGWE